MKKKAIPIYTPKKYPKRKHIPRNYKKAIKDVTKTIKHHFKKDKWDLDYNFLIEELFYKANGFHLEAYLLPIIFDGTDNLSLYYKNHKLVVGVKKTK